MFGTARESRFEVMWPSLLGPKFHHDLSVLETPFTKQEVKMAIFELVSDKAPGPDSFPLLFFQKIWEIVEEDIFNLWEDFY